MAVTEDEQTTRRMVAAEVRHAGMHEPNAGGHCVRKHPDSDGTSPVTVCELAPVKLLLSPLAYNAYEPVTGFLFIGSIVQAMTQPPRNPW
jgi:hypothetical protein